MDALRKQASNFKEQVAKQQQADIKQLSGTGCESSDVMVIDRGRVAEASAAGVEKYYRSIPSSRISGRMWLKPRKDFLQ